MKPIIIANDREHLKDLIYNELELNGSKCNLNHIDVSQIITMNGLFTDLDFNGDISLWNVSNVIEMRGLFAYSTFNGDISKWDVSNVKDMHEMFRESEFNGDISDWDVSNVENMFEMFRSSKFKGDISNWKPYNLKSPPKSMLYRGIQIGIHIPYWIEYDDQEVRRKAINAYHWKNELNKELTSELSLNEIKEKKLKI
jgi:hypothetical protein